ncbi:hypothetical protein [Paraburkholderia sp. MM6662-R1]|uniref:hypothetical protein n=1 Tax=Paraburkholderia sp. MM6662-R1 TaxID=2991066 RepID=UPI003D232206
MKDIAGQTFGRLTAIRRVEGQRWLFRCECGTEKVLHGAVVRSGHTRSCGCLRRELARGLPRHRQYQAMLDMEGRRFGMLTALHYDHSSARGAMWRFRCDCGTTLVLCAKDIRYGGRTSCGCVARSKHERQNLQKRPRGQGGDQVFDGLSVERLGELAALYGVDGPADGMVAFARRIRMEALMVDGQPVMMSVLRGD